jgi:ABC-type glycerol-3-phosphate transport system substrate-binding protein
MQEYFSDVAPALVEASMYAGSLYVLPRLQSPAVLFYNTRLFAQAGIERPKDTWAVADFLEIAKKIAASKPGTAGFGWPNRLWGGAVPWFFVFGGNVYDESHAPGGDWLWSGFYKDDPHARGRGGGFSWGAPRANSPEMAEALGFLQDLTYLHKAAPPPAAFDDLANLFAAGKLAMLPADRSLVGRLQRADMKAADFDILPMPAAKTQRHQFGASSIALLKSSASPELAWPFMTFLVSKSEIADWVKGGLDTSSRRSVANDPKQHDGLGPAHWQLFYDALDKHPDSGPIPAPAQAKPMNAILVKWVGVAMDNELSAKAALDGMQSDLLELDRKTSRPA